MNRFLDYLWPVMDAPVPIMAAHVVAAWPAGVHQRLLDLGFLMQAADTDRVRCPECQQHFEEVIARTGPDGAVRFFVLCPEVLRAEVPPEARRRWAVNLTSVASALAATLGLTGSCTEQLPSRLWRLGRTTWQGSPRDVFLARGLHWHDAPAMRNLIARGRKPIVFVPEARPQDDFWHGRIPPVLALSQVATVSDTGIDVDPLEMAAAIQDSDERAANSNVTAIHLDQLRLIIRQMIKVEEKNQLSDDIFVSAYRQHGSIRQAAAFLSQETGQEVSKDQVHRVLQRAGGAAAVLTEQNSDSVLRSSGSAKRGRAGKKLNQPNT